MPPVIQVENLSKRYFIGAGVRSLRSALTELPLRLVGRKSEGPAELWALRDVTFSVEGGESLGILGHNGAGKTTMLKILSGITYPTYGDARVDGRLGSLIELGAGFHPEMTGRENVYLNGVILGMTRKEVARKFDSIIDFAGIESYIDTPVKRYSSGMYVRLAFAVAAHIDPKVLLVDEVLAVGDIAFRAKCYRRMAELRKNGTTIVLVTHDVYAIRDTCDRALLFWKGDLIEDDHPDGVITSYLSRMEALKTEPISHVEDPSSLDGSTSFAKVESSKARIAEVTFVGEEDQPVSSVRSGGRLSAKVRYLATDQVHDPIFRLDFYKDGQLATGFSTAYDGERVIPILGDGVMSLNIENLYLPAGVYSVSVILAEAYEHNLLDVHHQSYPLEVLRDRNARGNLRLPHTWQHSPVYVVSERSTRSGEERSGEA